MGSLLQPEQFKSRYLTDQEQVVMAFSGPSLSFTFGLMLFMNLCVVPKVDAGPLTATMCLMSCGATACSGVAATCGAISVLTGPAAMVAAIPCLVAAGGTCGACVSACSVTVVSPI